MDMENRLWNFSQSFLHQYNETNQFIENQRPLHVSNITFSSSGGSVQTALGLLRAYNVSW
jgi:hypothetical protein